MRFYYWLERQKFEDDWMHKRMEYQAAGMREIDIQEMYEFDLTLFRQERVYQTRNVPLEPYSSQNCIDALDKSKRLLRYSDTFTQSDQHDWNDLSSIPDQTDNPKIYRLFQEMDETNIRLLSLLLDGYTQSEIAVLLGVSQPAISKRIIKIKKLLE